MPANACLIALQGLVKQNQADVLNAFAASSAPRPKSQPKSGLNPNPKPKTLNPESTLAKAFVAEDEELTVAPAKAHNWSMVSVLVNSTQRASAARFRVAA